MKLIDYHKLKKRKYKEVVESLGGRFSWLQRLKMGGTGVGGLTLPKNHNPDVMLRFPDTTEPVKFSIEMLNNGILLGFNNTKEVKILPFIKPLVSFDVIQENISLKGLRKVQIVKLHIDDTIFVTQTDGWNAKEVQAYFTKLRNYFNSKQDTI